jgi:hypothetical protein
MKKIFKPALILLALFAFNEELNAQGLKLPQPSTAQSVTQDFALGKVNINYARPNVKGRKIFGDLIPFGQVWRTGANNATTIKFTDDVKIEGHALAAGEYALFTIPGKTEWAIIFSKNTKQWGSYAYTESDDVLRVKVKPTTTKDKTETFTIQLTDVFDTAANLQLLWENTAVNVKITTSIDEKVMANIDEAMKGDKKPYFQAAMYYFNNGKDLKTTLEWMKEAEKASPKAPHIKLWKGKVQMKMGDKAGAAVSAKEGLALATEAKNEEYIRLHSQLLEETKK